jgi:replicative DNA helicase
MTARTLPHSTDSEQAIICACILNPTIVPKVQAVIGSEDFYIESHGLLFDAICALGERTELTSVAQWLEDHGTLDQAGGHAKLMDLAEFASTSAGWLYHAGVLKDKATRRDIIKACARAADEAYGTEVPEVILSGLKERLRNLNTDTDKPYRTNEELVNAVWADIERRAECGNQYVGVRTGFRGIDEKVFGLEPKTTIYLIARPSIGKTALALNIGENVGGRVLFFSLESNAEAITRRRMAAKSKVFLWRIRTAHLEDAQLEHLFNAANELSQSRVIVLEKAAFKIIENLTAQAESIAMDGPISLIVVDHIQRMRSRKKFQNRHLELSWISEELSTLAKNLNVPVLILCQLSREAEKRGPRDKYPKLSDMKESGDLEANADQVWGLWRQDKESQDARLECLKGRDTGTWVAWLRFDRLIQQFFDASEPPEHERKIPKGEWRDDL